jgi:aminoglycoside phosphotransferase (APT) family kinase protein
VLSYIPGQTVGEHMPWPQWVWNEQLLAEVGRAAAAYHQAVRDFRPAGEVDWFFGAAALSADQIVCHHDIAPYNVVVEGGSLRGIIDWDLAGPGTVRSEVAFIAWQWVPLHDPIVTGLFGWDRPPDRGRRLRVLLDSYGLADRRGFIDDVMTRIEFNRDVMITRAAAGDVAYMRLEQEGHVWGMNQALAFLQLEGPALQAELG